MVFLGTGWKGSKNPKEGEIDWTTLVGEGSRGRLSEKAVKLAFKG